MTEAIPDVAESGERSMRFSEAPIARRSFELISIRASMNPTSDVLEHPFHAGAKSALAIVAILCIALVVTAPVGLWLLYRMATAKVRVSRSDVVAKGLFATTEFRFDDVARLGLLEVPVLASGIGGALARRRVGGDRAVYLVAQTKTGETRKFVVSSYANHQALLGEVGARAQKSFESINSTLFGIKWRGVT